MLRMTTDDVAMLGFFLIFLYGLLELIVHVLVMFSFPINIILVAVLSLALVYSFVVFDEGNKMDEKRGKKVWVIDTWLDDVITRLLSLATFITDTEFVPAEKNIKELDYDAENYLIRKLIMEVNTYDFEEHYRVRLLVKLNYENRKYSIEIERSN